MSIYTMRLAPEAVLKEVALMRARAAAADLVRGMQREREARRLARCAYCDRRDESARAIAFHNLRCSEFGERSYPRPAARGAVAALEATAP